MSEHDDVSHTDIYEKIGAIEARCDEGCGSAFTKRFPAGIILAILLQTFGVVWWAAGVDNTISALEKPVTEMEVRNYIAEREKIYMDMDNSRHLQMAERMARVESSYLYIEKALTRIEKKLMLIGTEKVK